MGSYRNFRSAAVVEEQVDKGVTCRNVMHICTFAIITVGLENEDWHRGDRFLPVRAAWMLGVWRGSAGLCVCVFKPVWPSGCGHPLLVRGCQINVINHITVMEGPPLFI